MTNLTQQEFDEMAEKFLATQDDTKDNEWYCTRQDIAAIVIEQLHAHLFADATHDEAERKEYLRLKAKYEMS